MIISFYPKFAVHPDHEATAEAVVRTVGRMPKESVQDFNSWHSVMMHRIF